VYRACHKGVIFGNIGKNNELRAADRIVISCKIGGFLYYLAHSLYGSHIYACFGGRNVYRRTDTARLGKRFGYSFDKIFGKLGARVYISASQPFSIFRYEGFSPEVPSGIDTQTYPVAATYSLGVSLTY
jgi:hypothetical protein